MNLKKSLRYSLIISVTLTAVSGCSVANKVKSVFIPQKEYEAVVTSGNNEKSIETPIAVIEEIKETSQQARHASPTKTRLSDRNLNGEWAIMSVYGQRIESSQLPYFEFIAKEGKIICENTCKTFNADYFVTRTGGLSFDNIIKSTSQCSDDKYDALIEKALGRAYTYKYEKHNGVLYVLILDKKGTNILTLKQHNLNILNGKWQVKSIGEKLMRTNNILLVIDIQSERLHGNSGCNIINGRIGFDSKKIASIQFYDINSSNHNCKNISVETDLLVALEDVEYFTIRNDKEIDLSNNKGNIVLTIQRAE